MLKADEINALRDTAESLTEPIVRYLLRDLADRVARAGQLTGTAQYEMWKLQQLGLSQKEIREKLRALLRVSGDGLEKLLTQSAEAGYRFDLRNLPTGQKIPFSENGVLQQIVSSAVKLARQDLENLTQTMGMIDPYGHFQPLRQAYVKCMDYAFMQVSTGAADYNTAIRQATKNLADMGVQVVDYRSGLHTNLETVVRRNVMSSMGLMQEQISRQNHDAMGADGWEIDAHYNSAPDHEPIQGKQYSDDAYTALNNSLVRRIGTLNCGHSAYPIHLGIDSPQYTAQELERMRQSNERGITFRGRHYTGYGATQKQRRLETAIRRQRHRILVDEAVGDGEKLRTDRMKLTALNQEYRAFSEEAGLRMQHERMEVVGYNWKQEAAAEKVGRGGKEREELPPEAKEESKNKYNDTAVNPFVKTSGYRNLYNNLDESTAIQRVACEKAREMLSHRSGTKYEDLTFIDTVTGKTLTRSDYDVENEVLPSLKMRRMVMNAEPHTIIAIHNHPGSSVPSVTDLTSAYEKNYKYGLIACHNGCVMRYNVLSDFNEVIVDQILDKVNKSLYNSDGTENRLETMLELLKTENVELEVFRR